MNFVAQLSFSSASASLANYTKIPQKAGRGPGQRQVFAVFVQSSGNASAASTLEFALATGKVSGSVVYKREQATCTLQASRRGGYDNASGTYLHEVEFEVSGNHKIDAAGEHMTDGANTVDWYVGLPTLGTSAGTVTVQIFDITEV